MKYIREIMRRGFRGMAFGVFINQALFAIMTSFFGLEGSIEFNALAQQFIISALFGFYAIAISIVFEIDSWSLLRQTIVHFILLSVVYFPVAIYANWLPEYTVARIPFAVFYILVYIIVWFTFKAYWKKKAMEINVELELRNR